MKYQYENDFSELKNIGKALYAIAEEINNYSQTIKDYQKEMTSKPFFSDFLNEAGDKTFERLKSYMESLRRPMENYENSKKN